MTKLIKKTAALAVCTVIALGSLASCKQDVVPPADEAPAGTPVQLVYTECSAADLSTFLSTATEDVVNIKITDTNPNMQDIEDALYNNSTKNFNLDLSSCTSLTNTDFVNAFYYFENLLSIVLPSSITSLSCNTFASCTNLTYVSIPSSVTFIGDEAFEGCTSLKAITIPSSVITLSSSAFEGCTALTHVNLSSGLTYIGTEAFKGCTGLKTITLPSTVTDIGDKTFEGCTALTSITIPASVTYIGDSPFCGCSSLSSISVASGNSTYDSRNNCNAVIKTDTNELVVACKNTVIPSSVTSLGAYVFEGRTDITSFTIPENITYISKFAFSDCTELTSITIPATVTEIDRGIFYGCSKLTSLTFEHKLWRTYANDVNLTLVNISDFTSSSGAYYNYTLYKKTLVYTECSAADFINTLTNATDDVVNIKITDTPSMIEFLSVPISNSTKKVNLDLSACTGLTEISIAAFNNCTGLNSIILPTTITSIRDTAFSGCTNLKYFTIPENVTSIEGDAFNGSGLEYISIPENVTTIGEHAFQGCSNLTKISFTHKKWTIQDPEDGSTQEIDLSSVNASDFTSISGAYCNYEITKRTAE